MCAYFLLVSPFFKATKQTVIDDSIVLIWLQLCLLNSWSVWKNIGMSHVLSYEISVLINCLYAGILLQKYLCTVQKLCHNCRPFLKSKEKNLKQK